MNSKGSFKRVLSVDSIEVLFAKPSGKLTLISWTVNLFFNQTNASLASSFRRRRSAQLSLQRWARIEKAGLQLHFRLNASRVRKAYFLKLRGVLVWFFSQQFLSWPIFRYSQPWSCNPYGVVRIMYKNTRSLLKHAKEKVERKDSSRSNGWKMRRGSKFPSRATKKKVQQVRTFCVYR